MLTLLINIILLVFAYTYLRDLQSCACVQPLYASRMKNIELLYIAFAVFALIAVLLPTLNLFQLVTSKLSRSLLLALSSLLGLFSTALYIYFSYNTYQFVRSTPASCACAQKWPRFYIYLQSLAPFIIVLFTIILTIAANFFEIPYFTAALKMLSNKSKTVSLQIPTAAPVSGTRSGTATPTGTGTRSGTRSGTGSRRRSSTAAQVTGTGRRTATGTGRRTATAV